MNEFKYLITDIQARTNVSITSLNAFKKKHQDFFSENSTRKQRKIYYNQAAMDFFVSYYCPDIEETPDKKDNNSEEQEKGEIPLSAAAYTDKPHEGELEASKAEIDALKAEIAALRKQLEEKEAERLELLRQHGALILTLQQEKHEKMLLLPPPKKSLGEKVKSIFHKDKA